MALPASNLTFHADASVVTDLWQTDTAGVFSTHPSDGGAVPYWDDPEHGAMVLGVADTPNKVPFWRATSTLLPQPCLEFDGVDDYLRLFANDGSTAKTLDDLITNTAFTVFLSFRAAAVTSTSPNAYNNDVLISDDNIYWGLFLGNDSGYKLRCFNSGGGVHVVEFPIALNTNYVVMFRHESGVIYASLNGGAESSLTSGNTAATFGNIRVGWANVATTFLTGRIGELAAYNVALTGSNLTDAMTYFTAKWLSAVPPRRLSLLGVG